MVSTNTFLKLVMPSLFFKNMLKRKFSGSCDDYRYHIEVIDLKIKSTLLRGPVAIF